MTPGDNVGVVGSAVADALCRSMKSRLHFLAVRKAGVAIANDALARYLALIPGRSASSAFGS
jgi:hypothetical protein